MKQAIEITQYHDIENPPMYVRYSRNAVARTLDIQDKGAVTVDLDEAGEVIGIELVCVDDFTIALARIAAVERGVSLPADLGAVFATT